MQEKETRAAKGQGGLLPSLLHEYGLAMKGLAVLLLCAALLVFGAEASIDECYQGDSDCPACPSLNSSFSLTSHIYLIFPEIVDSVYDAQLTINATARDDIISLEPLTGLHTSLNYFCCHTLDEIKKIVDVVQAMSWSPFNLTLSDTSCNVDHNGVTVYMLSIYDADSQNRLFKLVQSIEMAVRAAGIPINNPRKQPFHCTMARVNHQYPVDSTVEQIASKIKQYGQFSLGQFEIAMQPVYPK